MITKEFNNGWGSTWPWKKFERSVVSDMLADIHKDTSQSVIINSVWYTDEFHQEVLSWLRSNTWDRIILVSMLDPAIAKPERFSEFNQKVLCLGYYPGDNFLDFCALFLHKNIDLNKYGNLSEVCHLDTPYMCLNRKPHWHRRKFYRQLESLRIVDHGMVTMGDESGVPLRTLPNDQDPDLVAPNSETHHYGIPNNVCDLGPADVWNRCFFNVVTETVYDINRYHFVSEKIYKPILGQRPFVVYDPDGGENWLSSRGFETYHNDFRDISDHDPGDPDHLAFFLKDLCRQPQTYFGHKMTELCEKIQHNRQNFDRYIIDQEQKIKRGLVL